MQLLLDEGVPFVLWGANENLLQLINGFDNPSRLVCIDSNRDKKDFLPGVSVCTPDMAKDQIQKSDCIFICAGRHRDAILGYIKSNFQKEFNEKRIHVLDREVL